MNKIYLIIITLVLAASCSIKYQQPEIDTQTLIRDIDPNDNTFEISSLKWKEFYQDPLLQELIDSALINNLDLRVAIKRIEESSEYFKQGKASFYPTLGTGVNANYGKSVLNTETSPYFSFGFNASWEIDIWDKLGSAKRAKYQDLLAQINTKNAIQTSLISNLATAYINLISLDSKKKYVLETIKNREEYLETVISLKESAQVNEVAVLQAKAQLLEAQTYIPNINNAIQQSENSICKLLGKTPRSIKRSSVESLMKNTLKLDSIGVPANLLRNRPDVLSAENNVISFMENYNSAKAALYPSLTIS